MMRQEKVSWSRGDKNVFCPLFSMVDSNVNGLQFFKIYFFSMKHIDVKPG